MLDVALGLGLSAGETSAMARRADSLLGADWQQTHARASVPEGITLLFPMNDLFERYVAVQLRRALAGSGLEVVAQGGLLYCLEPWNGEGGYSHATRPDILVRREGGEVLCVIDTKWKPLAKGIAQADVYQMMAYARLYRCGRLILLYPAAPGEVGRRLTPRALAKGPERLDIARLNLSGGLDTVPQQLGDILGEALGARSGRVRRNCRKPH